MSYAVSSQLEKNCTTAEATNYMRSVGASVLQTAKTSDTTLLAAQAKRSVTALNITVASAGTYNGAAKTPAVSVLLKNNALRQGGDFILTYQNNVNAGVGSATITGIGDYKGSVTKAFTIGAAPISTMSIAAIANQTYTGKAIKPTPAISAFGKARSTNSDYTLAYANNINKGTASVTITGKGNFTGAITKTFKIVAAPVSVMSVTAIPKQTYTGALISPSPKVSAFGKKLTANSDYTLSYKNNKNTGTATITIKGKGNFTGSRTVSFKIVNLTLDKASVSGVGSKYYYTTSSPTPTPIVKLSGKTLKKGSDYTLSYSYKLNQGTGTGTVTATGKGKYKGKKSVSFTVENMGDDLARKACELSYSRKVNHGVGTKKYIAECKAAGMYWSPYNGRACIAGVTTAVKQSRYDKAFPKYIWDNRWGVKSCRSYFHYLQVNEQSSDTSQVSSKWQCVGTYPKDKSKLLPGDVLLLIHSNGRSGNNHIWMYVGSKIAKEVYSSKLKGTDADKGTPTGEWVQAHAGSLSAPSIEGPNNNYNNSPNQVRIYRCIKPDCKK